MALLEVEGLQVTFHGIEGSSRVVRNLDLRIERGERVALVGESGSGKSVTARAVLGLLPNKRAETRGSVRFDGITLSDIDGKGWAGIRGARIAMVFQDPSSTLNPVFRVEDQLAAIAHAAGNISDRSKMAALLRAVAIAEPDRVLRAYPFQLSGGIAQRVLLAAALYNEPELIIADEPASALDADIQRKSLELLAEVSRSQGTSVLLITHHLGLVRGFAETVHVMYAGEIVESASVEAFFRAPSHPYSQALLASVPRLSAEGLPTGIDGEPPDYLRPPAGCRFEPRCPEASPACREEVAVQTLGDGHRVRCVLGARDV